MKTFGERLKYLIKSSEIKTNKRFCERAQFSEQTLSRLIQGKTKPSYEFMVTLVLIFPDVDLKWLLTGKEQLPTDELEKQIEIEVKKQVKKRVESALAKRSSNGMNPQKTIPGFEPFVKSQLMEKWHEKVSDSVT